MLTCKGCVLPQKLLEGPCWLPPSEALVQALAFMGVFCSPRGETRLQESTHQSLAAEMGKPGWVKIQGCAVGPPRDGHQGSSTVVLSRRFICFLLFQPWEETHMASDVGFVTHMAVIL